MGRRLYLDAFQIQYVGQLLEEHKGNSATARAAVWIDVRYKES